MSTKIHHGYVIKTDDMATVLRVLDEVGTRYDKAARKYMATLTAHIIADAWDVLTMRGSDAIEKIPELAVLKDSSLSWYAYRHILERQSKIKATGQRDPAVDFQCDVIIFPEIGTGRTLALLFSENQTFKDCFLDDALVSYLGWWNNSDKPDDVTEEEWDQRGKDWDRAVGNDVPARRGLSRSYETFSGPNVTSTEIIAAMEPLEKRVRHLALESVMSDYPVKPDKDSIGSWYHAAKEWTSEGTRLKDRTAQILPLMSNPTKDQLSFHSALKAAEAARKKP